jgi:hypothetical protein
MLDFNDELHNLHNQSMVIVHMKFISENVNLPRQLNVLELPLLIDALIR